MHEKIRQVETGLKALTWLWNNIILEAENCSSFGGAMQTKGRFVPFGFGFKVALVLHKQDQGSVSGYFSYFEMFSFSIYSHSVEFP